MNLIWIVFYLFTPKPNYCSCIPLPPMDDKQYNEYNLIVKGNVVKIEINDLDEKIYLKIDTCYKGENIPKTVTIISPNSAGMCGIFPKVSEQWLIFAYTDGKNFTTNLCTRTKTLNSKAWDYRKNELNDDLNFLRIKLSNKH